MGQKGIKMTSKPHILLVLVDLQAGLDAQLASWFYVAFSIKAKIFVAKDFAQAQENIGSADFVVLYYHTRWLTKKAESIEGRQAEEAHSFIQEHLLEGTKWGVIYPDSPPEETLTESSSFILKFKPAETEAIEIVRNSLF